MRLLDVKTLELHEFFDDDETREYAILSHTWGAKECTFQHMTAPSTELRDGYRKIMYCCKQAAEDGLQWAWIDTCCIDKTNLVELSEAINSMFRWYQKAKCCYVYLEDVQTIDDMETSRWFTRGWTLQELIAPRQVRLYSATWQYLGDKLHLYEPVSEITGIDSEVLLTGQFDQVTVAQRMRWAANRKTTRAEDSAYCLLGLFGVNMPLLYGEGTKAFSRLQEGIMKVSDDFSLYAWNLPTQFDTVVQGRDFPEWGDLPDSKEIPVPEHCKSQPSGLLAESPTQFLSQFQLRATPSRQVKPGVVVGDGVQVELSVVESNGHKVAILPCAVDDYPDSYLGFIVYEWDGLWAARGGRLLLVQNSFVKSSETKVLFIKKPRTKPTIWHTQLFRLRLVTETMGINLVLEDLYCLPHVTKIDHRTMEVWKKQAGPLGAYILTLQGHGRVLGGRGLPEARFAAIVGLDMPDMKSPWLVVVPLLRSDQADKDFRVLLQLDAGKERLGDGWIRYCMTERQLKERLENFRDTRLPFPEELKPRFWRQLMEWEELSPKPGNLAASTGHFYGEWNKQHMSLWIEGKASVVQRNLFEEATVICVTVVQLYGEVKVVSSRRVQN